MSTTYTYDTVTYTVYTYYTQFQQNTYDQNYASLSSGILNIYGGNLIQIVGDTFTNNGDMFDEKISEIWGL